MVLKSTSEHHTIYDTAAQLGGKLRFPPSPLKFLPVGHVELRLEKNEDIPGLNEKDVAYSIHSLFVSSSIQSTGLGGAVLKAAEEVASQPPHNATELILYTIDREANMSKARYASKGLDVPKVSRYHVHSLFDILILERSYCKIGMRGRDIECTKQYLGSSVL